MSPEGCQRGDGAVPGEVVLDVPFCPQPCEIGWPDLGNQIVRFSGYCELVPASTLASVFFPWALTCFATSSSRLFRVLGFALSSSAKASLLDPGCPLIHQWKTHPWAPTACTTDLGLLLPSGKLDPLVWGSRPSGFPVSGPCWWPMFP
jgi:hypothetical protein